MPSDTPLIVLRFADGLGVLGHEPPGDGKPPVVAGSFIDAADSMEPGDGEHDEGAGTWLDTVGDFKIRFVGTMAGSLLIDDELPAPI